MSETDVPSGKPLRVEVLAPDVPALNAEVDHVYFVNPDTHGDIEDIASRADYEDGETILFVNASVASSVAVEGDIKPTDFSNRD